MRYLICLLTLSVIACRPSADVSPAGLYRTFSYIQRDYGSADRTILVTLTRQNEVRFGADQQLAICCAPTRFRAAGNTIEFLGPAVPNPVCDVVDCRLSDLFSPAPWQIERLTTTELVIATAQQRLVLTAQ